MIAMHKHDVTGWCVLTWRQEMHRKQKTTKYWVSLVDWIKLLAICSWLAEEKEYVRERQNTRKMKRKHSHGRILGYLFFSLLSSLFASSYVPCGFPPGNDYKGHRMNIMYVTFTKKHVSQGANSQDGLFSDPIRVFHGRCCFAQILFHD